MRGSVADNGPVAKRRSSLSIEDPHQLALPFAPAGQREGESGRRGEGEKDWDLLVPASPSPRVTASSFNLQMQVDFPQGADPDVMQRLEKAGRRLRRGGVAAKWKLKKLAAGLEDLAGLFDGVK